VSYPQPSYPSPYQQPSGEEDRTTIWWLMGCGAIITLAGLCVCGLIFSVAFLNALSRATPTPFLAKSQQPTSAPAPQESAQPISTPFPSPPPSLTPPSAPQPGGGSVGQRFEMSGIGLTANSVSREAREGFACVTVDVTIENISRDTVSYSPLHFKIKDSEGSEYTTACATNDQGLQSGELSQGSQVQGKVSLQVPQSATGLLLIYQELGLSGGHHNIIEIDLGP
jgi:hypothetical protein